MHELTKQQSLVSVNNISDKSYLKIWQVTIVISINNKIIDYIVSIVKNMMLKIYVLLIYYGREISQWKKHAYHIVALQDSYRSHTHRIFHIFMIM